jgi:hypothetical protein
LIIIKSSTTCKENKEISAIRDLILVEIESLMPLIKMISFSIKLQFSHQPLENLRQNPPRQLQPQNQSKDLHLLTSNNQKLQRK